jgi:6-pyruvoyltetrahydropterin/6-carboxytetrahydropterin synthase
MSKRIAITRKEHFNAAHRLHNPNWSPEKNTIIYGKCNNPSFHGHNYDLHISIIGEADPETGYVIDAKILSNIIKTEILNLLDHKNLNVDVPQFKFINPTAENIAVVIFDILRTKIAEHLDIKIKLYETPRNYVEYPYTA